MLLRGIGGLAGIVPIGDGHLVIAGLVQEHHRAECLSPTSALPMDVDHPLRARAVGHPGIHGADRRVVFDLHGLQAGLLRCREHPAIGRLRCRSVRREHPIDDLAREIPATEDMGGQHDNGEAEERSAPDA